MSANIYPLTSFGCLKISGPDVKNFMQNQVTCDINKTSESQLSLTAYCNDKGRISASGYIFMKEDAFYFLTPKSLIANTQQKFKQYGIFSNIATEYLSEIDIIACIGEPKGIKVPSENNLILNVSENVHVACINKQSQQYIIFGEREFITPVQEKLAKTRGINLSLDLYQWEQANIDTGIIHIYPETLDKLTPHMANYHLNNAVCFNKGCFLGQEVIARTQHRGRSKRKLYYVSFDDNTHVNVGDMIYTDCDEQAGIVVSQSSNKDKTNMLVVLSDHTIKSKLSINKNYISTPELVTMPQLEDA